MALGSQAEAPRDLPLWPPLLLGPIASLLLFLAACGSAPGPPSGDTAFAWLPVMALVSCAAAYTATAALLIVLALARRADARVKWRVGVFVAVAGTLVNVASICVTYGFALDSSQVPGDGFPRGGLGLLAIAGVLSLGPMVWLWKRLRANGHGSRSDPAHPNGGSR